MISPYAGNDSWCFQCDRDMSAEVLRVWCQVQGSNQAHLLCRGCAVAWIGIDDRFSKPDMFAAVLARVERRADQRRRRVRVRRR